MLIQAQQTRKRPRVAALSKPDVRLLPHLGFPFRVIVAGETVFCVVALQAQHFQVSEALLANGSTQKFIAQRYHTTEANLHNWMKKHGIRKPQSAPPLG